MARTEPHRALVDAGDAAATCGAPTEKERSASGSAQRNVIAAPAVDSRPQRPFWREVLAPYEQPRIGRSLLDLATAVVPYLALSVAMYFTLSVSYALTLALAVPTAGFLLRTYILFHDCSHGSFLPSKRANAFLGTALGLIVHAPFRHWRH